MLRQPVQCFTLSGCFLRTLWRGARNLPLSEGMATYHDSCLSSSFLTKKRCASSCQISSSGASSIRVGPLFLCRKGNARVRAHTRVFIQVPDTQIHKRELGADSRNCLLRWNYLQSQSTSFSFSNRPKPGPAAPFFFFFFTYYRS